MAEVTTTEVVPARFRTLADYYDASYPPSLWLVTPVLDSIDPTSRVVGPTTDVVLHCHGSDFTTKSRIVFADQEERTDFVSDSEVTTIITGSMFTGPDIVDVFVRTAGADPPDSDVLSFEFTPAEDAPAEPEPASEPETYDPGDHTVADVETYAAEHPDEREAILAAERAGKNRSTLIAALEAQA